MKKFILFNSPIFWDTTKEKEQYLSPLGLGYIATYLEKAGIDVTIVDCVKERKSVTDIANFINKMHPDYIGINIFTQNYEMVKFIIESIEIPCDCFIGGQAVKSIYFDILQWDTQNRLNIIIGEGEFIIPALVLGLCNQIPEEQKNQKFVYRVNKDSEYFPEDISNVFLDRRYLGNEIVDNHYGEKEIAIITSRGCAFDCAFCGGARSLNKDVTTRIRTEESVIMEIKEILSTYPDIQSIRILDDLFLRNGKSIDMANNIFSKEEMQKLVSYLWNLYEQNTQYTVPLALLFDFATGLRPGELVALKFSDIDSDNMLHIQRQAVKKRSADGKLDGFKIVDHAKSRSRNKPVYLSQDALFILNLAKEANEKNGDTQEGFIFYNNHEQLPASTATACLRKACKEEGIPVRGLYRIRKTYASLLIDSGVNIPMVTTAMGHSSIDITYRHYVRDISSRSETAIAIEGALNGRVTPSNTKILQKMHSKNALQCACRDAS